MVPGLVRLHSISRPGQSEVTLEFATGSRMDLASLAVREKLDLVSLPREARRPAVLRFDPSLDPFRDASVFQTPHQDARREAPALERDRDAVAREWVEKPSGIAGQERPLNVRASSRRLDWSRCDCLRNLRSWPQPFRERVMTGDFGYPGGEVCDC